MLLVRKVKGKSPFLRKVIKIKQKNSRWQVRFLENAPYKISGALERLKKKVFGKGVDAVKAQQESVPAPKQEEKRTICKR